MSRVQGDQSQDGPADLGSRILGSHLRSQGRILAYTVPKVLQELPSIPGGRSSILLRSDAVRAEHHPQDLHQGGRCSDKGVTSKSKILAYLDDWIIRESSPQVQSSLRKVNSVITKYSCLINKEK